MPSRDPRIDDYIARQRDFAQPMLRYFREVVHEGCPECEETLKWGAPSFTYKGAILAGMAGFKAHVIFGFWKHKLLFKDKPAGMGSFGHITAEDKLPSRRELVALVKKAVKLEDDGVKVPNLGRAKRKPIPMPKDFSVALGKRARAKTVWAGFPPSHKREYLEWITEAKREETRRQRIDQAVTWIAEGKQRNWKYQ